MCKMLIALTISVAVYLPTGIVQADIRWTPSVEVSAIHDDNVQFSANNAIDDTIYAIRPGVRLNYDHELTKIAANGRVLIRKYNDNDDLDDQVYQFDLKANTKFTERFYLRGGYEFIKDTTLDSELEEVGRIFFREDRINHKATLSPSFNLTERTSIGISGRYGNVAYDSDTKIDNTLWSVGLPVRWRLNTQLDSIQIGPSYTCRESDINRSDNYYFNLGWDRKTTERFTFKALIAARWTELENIETGEKNDSTGVKGDLKFKYGFETGSLAIDLNQNLTYTANGEQVDVSRVILTLKWNFTERMGMKLKGRYYHTRDENEGGDNSSEFMQAGSELFYNLTENHNVFIAYQYARDDNDNSDTQAERNRVWAGINFNFPY